MPPLPAPDRPESLPPRPAGHPPARPDTLGREAFLGILSHELRTPVTTIYGGANLLAGHDLSDERRRIVALEVGQEAEHLYRIIEDLLVLLRAERGTLTPVGEPVAIGRVIVAAVEREIVRNPRLQIRYLGTQDAAVDGVDEQLVVHAVRNLLASSIAASTAGSPIEIVVEVHPAEVVVRFLDSGPIDGESDLAMASPERPPARASLALVAARHLIEAMHGRSWALARADGGAELGFALPSEAPAAAAPPVPRAPVAEVRRPDA